MVTFSGSGPVLAMAKKANACQTPITAVLAIHPDITKENDYVNQICFDNIFQGNVAVFFVRDDLLVERMAIFKTPDNSHSSNLAADFEGLMGKITIDAEDKAHCPVIINTIRNNQLKYIVKVY